MRKWEAHSGFHFRIACSLPELSRRPIPERTLGPFAAIFFAPVAHRAPSITQLTFRRRAADIIGLYLNPFERAAVFCVDEKTAIKTLDRLDSVLSLSPGRIESDFLEYRCHGTLSLYAALETATRRVNGKTTARHNIVALH